MNIEEKKQFLNESIDILNERFLNKYSKLNAQLAFLNETDDVKHSIKLF